MSGAEPRLTAPARPRAARTQATQAAPADDEAARRIRALENRLSAQAWDIKGLTSQRDEAYEDRDALRAELAALREELLTLSRTTAAELTRHDSHRRDIETGAALSRQVRHETVQAAAKLVRAAATPAEAAIAEAMLVRASGLFDEEFYRAQRDHDRPAEMDAALSYVTEGEASGRPPNRLFVPDGYRE